MGNSALVIGNGESRQGLDLSLFECSTTIGCNAAYRDVALDHLVCCDKRTVKEAVANFKSPIYTRDEWCHLYKVNPLPALPYQGTDRADEPRHWGSGGYALLLAATLNYTNIKMIGFDLYSNNNLVNNIYKDTDNYSPSTSHAVDHSYWIYQISKIFSNYPQISFTIINNKEWIMPTEWQFKNTNFEALVVDL
jgi:hypothetical protein